jgi:Methylase involved in ubiquinone/menaquinone biosynthesis
MKQRFKSLFRKAGLLPVLDLMRFYVHYLSRFYAIQKAKKNHPNFIFPPAYYIYETYQLDFENYYTDGKNTAKDLVACIQKHTEIVKNFTLLDWGCGPGRVVRHFSELLPEAIIYASDYNKKYIRWCSEHLNGIQFLHNELLPPIRLQDNSLHVIYSLSILTHLSEKAHQLWIQEIYRLLKPNGIAIITTHGTPYVDQLNEQEKIQFEKGYFVEQATDIEGNRTYTAYQPEAYIKSLVKDFQVVEFIPGGNKNSIHGKQDTWVLRK